MANESYTQVATDGSGRKIESLPVTVPAGTYVTNTDGTRTKLTADIVVFRQGMVIADPSTPGQFAEVSGAEGRGALMVGGAELAMLSQMNKTLHEILTLLTMALEN